MNIKHILTSIQKAENLESKLNNDVFNLQGMSGIKGRCLLNNLCNFEGINYFEVGTWKGSTIISSAYNNIGIFTANDNFSQFGGPKQDLMSTKDKFKDVANFEFIEGDCWNINHDLIPQDINVYFFDGAHDYESQRKAIGHFLHKMAKKFILIVDDWNDKSYAVPDATRQGIRECGLKNEFSIEIGHHVDSDSVGYWNGFGIFLLEK